MKAVLVVEEDRAVARVNFLKFAVVKLQGISKNAQRRACLQALDALLNQLEVDKLQFEWGSSFGQRCRVPAPHISTTRDVLGRIVNDGEKSCTVLVDNNKYPHSVNRSFVLDVPEGTKTTPSLVQSPENS